MATPELDYFDDDWIEAPAGPVRLRIVASPPVAAGASVVVFTRPTPIPDATPTPWVRAQEADIDNIPATPVSDTFQFATVAGNDYVIRFEGGAHLLMPGFQEVTVGFEVTSQRALLTNYGGPKTAEAARAAGLNGNAWLHCA